MVKRGQYVEVVFGNVWNKWMLKLKVEVAMATQTHIRG